MFGLSGLLESWRRWRVGGITGLNYLQSEGKMGAILAVPWLLGYMGCFMFVPDPFLEVSILLMSALWGMYCYGIYSYAKVYATRHRNFPQSAWKFPDGGATKYDLMIPPDGFFKVCDFADGGEGWFVDLGRRYQYWDRRSEFPFVFSYAFWKLKGSPLECFRFLTQGEFFCLGLAIKHPACEDISVYVKDWVQDERGRYAPVCAINDCSLTFEEFAKEAEFNKTQLSKIEKLEIECDYERAKFMSLKRHASTLEDINEADQADARNYRKDVDQGMSKIRNTVKTVMDTEKPLIQRIKGSLWKIAAIAGLIILALWFFKVI
ncbi:MAG: hypothetical protein JSW58_11835 [Candidatus Latescibacterota bacterium]|nr:MAG: hypothetical protein JSW58_11835 [Candidatus Latescibacterota bacterium]